jgi:subtilase family serine protease
VADDVGVALSVDRADLDTATIDQLAAGESRVVSFTGPACRREVGVVVDPDNSIGERVESDNSRLFVCS